MSEILKQWIKDTDAFEFQKLYGVTNTLQYDFIARQGDFYITLLNKMYNSLQTIEDSTYESISNELVEIAQAMLVYSERISEQHFEDIDKESNHLYVASLFFLAGYEAVATFILKQYSIENFTTVSAKTIYYIISGGEVDLLQLTYNETKEIISRLNSFIQNGDDGLTYILSKTEEKITQFTFSSLDDFFDTEILLHVLKKYAKHNLWNSLKHADNETNWKQYIQYSQKQHILSLLPSQEDAISKGLLSFQKSFSLKMPTSAGKSYITELVIYQEFQRNVNTKILYLAPLRSLSRELKQRYTKVGKELGFTVRAIYGGSTFTIEQNILDEAQLLISTPETFITLEDSLEENLSRYSLVICDEGQLLDSLNRGINYELLLTRLKKIDRVRFLFLSAIIPNIKDVNTWLGGSETEVGDSTYRPCPIKLGQLDDNFTLSIKDYNYTRNKYLIPNFLSIDERTGIGSTLKSISCAIALKSCIAGPTMLFTARKSGNKGCNAIGIEIDRILSLRHLNSPKIFSIDISYLDLLAEYLSFQLGETHLLPQFIRNGYAYHHGGLPQDMRELIEEAYEKKIIPLIICTNTLAEGVNLPVQTIILHCLDRYNNERERNVPLDVTEIKNIVGRSGRAGRQRFGVVLFPNSKENRNYSNLVSALKDTELRQIMGTLFDVVRVFYELGDKLNDEQLNKILEKFELASAIDTMITRSLKIEDFEKINIDDIVKESLAYHVGDDNIKQNLRRVFKIRHNILNKYINNENFSLYHNSGMTINDIVTAEEIINKAEIQTIDFQNSDSEIWFKYMISVITRMPSFKNTKIRQDGQEFRELSEEEIIQLLSLWVGGKQYHEIATELHCEVDNAIDLVFFLQNNFHTTASSVVRYIEGIGIDISNLSTWIDMLKYGVNSREKLLLIRSGLNDRIIANFLGDSALIDILNFENARSLNESMKVHKSEILTYISTCQTPKLCTNRLEQYLNQ